MYQLKKAVKIVDLLFAVRPLAARAVKPNVKNFTVTRQKLCELRFVVIIIFFRSVKLRMSVLRGKIKSEFKTVPAAGFGEFSDNIAFAVFVRTSFHTVIGVFGLPEAKSVMVLCRNNNAGHSCGFYRFAPAVTVEVYGIEDRRILLAGTPFKICVCIRAEMNKSIKGRFG